MKLNKLLFTTTLLSALVLMGSCAKNDSKDFLASNEGMIALSLLLSDNSLESSVAEVRAWNVYKSNTFDTDGTVLVSVLAMDSNGDAILDENLKLSGAELITDADNIELEPVNIPMVKEPQNTQNPWSFSIDVDSSGSMATSDPDRLRVDAAKLFVDTIFANKEMSQMRITDFGAGSDSGYSYSRLLQNFTSDRSLIFAGIDSCTNTNNTPLYESVFELLDTFNTDVSSASYDRAFLVLSDGEPTLGTKTEADVVTLANSYHIPINTVALGSGTFNDTLRSLSNQTNGIFTYAKDANDLSTAFENVALGNAKGYMVYTLVVPTSERDKIEIPNTIEVSIGSASTKVSL